MLLINLEKVKSEKMNKILILFMICVLGYSCANNQLTRQTITKGSYSLLRKSEVEDTRIIGLVKEKKTGKILSSANVSIVGHNDIGTVTDKQGYFTLEVFPGDIQIEVSNVGHSDLKTKVIKIKPKEQLEIHFFLRTFEIN